jgi:hypothetical protein
MFATEIIIYIIVGTVGVFYSAKTRFQARGETEGLISLIDFYFNDYLTTYC